MDPGPDAAPEPDEAPAPEEAPDSDEKPEPAADPEAPDDPKDPAGPTGPEDPEDTDSDSISARRRSNRSPHLLRPEPIRPSHPGTRDFMRPLPPSPLLSTTRPGGRDSSPGFRPYRAEAPHRRTVGGFRRSSGRRGPAGEDRGWSSTVRRA
ncbi:hypothetical protein GCM10027075_59470 [Streptomyces heilongjiangensis]